ncbi:MAG: molybdopterin synthase sulfur carrier subunit [Verrucomicrobiales bacterium]|jgi:molybdopterin synthase sulfur carrier subunit
MATVSFTQNLRQHIGSDLPPIEVEAATVAAAFEQVLAEHPQLRGYIFDDQGAVRKHVVVFLDGETVTDRVRLSDPLPADGELFVTQALSGG